MASDTLTERACILACLEPAAIDRAIAIEVAAAVRAHRLEEAIGWQRVRLRAHRLRRDVTAACRG